MSEALSLFEPITLVDSEYTILEPGVYEFTVKTSEHKSYDGGAKIDPCDMFQLTLDCESVDNKQHGSVRENIYLVSSQLWKLTQLLKCTGFAPESSADANGNPVKMDKPIGPILTSEIVGAVGYAEITKRKYTGRDGDERETNSVKRFLTPSQADEVFTSKMGKTF